ncbi:hypothetical protein APHAL10511_002760 [Amanita phalloides]|nr:hypothetical protein APHAL10511_002760 [Amanita phalloides]
MPKRHVDVDSDDASSHASKRIRTQEYGAHASSSKNKENIVVDEVDIVDEDAEEGSDVEIPKATNGTNEEDQEAEENKFEQEHGEKIRQSIDAKRNHQGGVADYGILESIEMHQFMCHKWLKFNFGPQINFIIGNSLFSTPRAFITHDVGQDTTELGGKSAVLSAIAIALGGKANSTGRGSGLKAFIREGQSLAEVTITIKNHGEEAYKPKEYGKSIVITRRFTKEGTSTWKIKSKDGHVVSSKREELSAICDHMNIQVDNPLNVLTQGNTTQTINIYVLYGDRCCTPIFGILSPGRQVQGMVAKLFTTFFLKGTQLAQLSEEYDICLENISQSSKIVARKREALPDLRTALREAVSRYEEASKAREQRKKVDELKKELAWAHVKSKELEMEEKLEISAKANRKLPRVEQQLADARIAFDAATDEVAQLEQEYRALGNMDDIGADKEALQAKIRENKARILEFNSDIKLMDSTLLQLAEQIARYNKDIEAEGHRVEKHTQAKREETDRKLDEAKQVIKDAEGQRAQLAAEFRELDQQNTDLMNVGKEEDARAAELKSQVQRYQEIIEQCKRKENDKYVPYGNNIKLVMEKIRKMNWAGEIPLGPLGLYVNAKDPDKWGTILRHQLGSYLTAFAITDARDRPVLKKMLSESGNPNTLIVIYVKDMFDFGHGEPREDVLTVNRSLEISDPYVLRILINFANVERIVLAGTRKDGDQCLRGLGGGTGWTSDGFLVRVFPDGGVSSTKLDNMGRTNPLLLTGRDATGEMRHYGNELGRAQEELAAVVKSVMAKRREYSERQKQIEQIKTQMQAIEDTIRKARYTRDTLQQEANDNLPANIAGLETAKQEVEEEKESIKIQAQEAMEKKAQLGDKNRELLTQLNKLTQRLNEFHKQQQGIKAVVEDAVAKRVVHQNNINHYEKKLEDEMKVIRVAEQAAEIVQEEFRTWREQALEFCEPVENPRKAEVVQRNLDSVQKALKEREKRHGASVEDMTVEVNKAKAKLDTVQAELRQMSSLNKALKKSLTMRLARWQEFRRHIALRCKLVFQYNLSHRGYFGKILFNHVNQTLQIKVQTDDQIATQGNRDKDPRSLSGGEKSFSTICLLLSLWESIGCPLRCLDEFDVFMDPINRRVSMKMMIESAHASDKKQYILITPQDMTSITPSNAVRVLRMSDPERGQGVLRFGS